MKKIIFILVICLFSQIPALKAQLQPGECGIKFTYDATGSIIKREFICNNTGGVMYRTGKGENTKTDSIKTSNNNEIAEEDVVKVNAIMPNPTTGMFTVTLSTTIKNGNVILLNANGSVLENKKRSGNILSFDISNHASGIYFVRIEYEGNVLTFKVIKQ